jgi:hypothetical protein
MTRFFSLARCSRQMKQNDTETSARLSFSALLCPACFGQSETTVWNSRASPPAAAAAGFLLDLESPRGLAAAPSGLTSLASMVLRMACLSACTSTFFAALA